MNTVLDGLEWKRPNDVMKKIKRQKFQAKSVSLSQPQTSVQSRNIPNKACNEKKVGSFNPFCKKRSCSDSSAMTKRRILSITSDQQDSSTLSDIANTSNPSCFDEHEQYRIDQHTKTHVETLSNNDLGFVYLNEDSIQGIFTDQSCTPVRDDFEKQFPPDWTLKTKARFLSPSTFAWCARVKGGEEARAISQACQCPVSDSFRYSSSATVPSEKISQPHLRIELVKRLVYWQHPTLPWLTLFPRYGEERSLGSGSRHGGSAGSGAGEPVSSEHVKTALYDGWVTAFRSIFQMLLHNVCPYFYLCSQQYTALFRGRLFSSQVSCVLTPTSLGFRNALKAEGIEFTMVCERTTPDVPTNNIPNTEQLSRPLFTHSPTETDEDEARDEQHDVEPSDELPVDDVEDEMSWKDISDSLQLQRGREARDAINQAGLPQTAVLVTGLSNLQLLYNYLLNCRSSIATSGPQTGVPPTILSPAPFLGSKVHKLDFRAGIAKTCDADNHTQRGANNFQQRFSLDVSGPLMPHHVAGLASLLARSQHDSGEYTAAFGTCPYTAPFNKANLDGGGAESGFDRWKADAVALRHLTATPAGFKWNS